MPNRVMCEISLMEAKLEKYKQDEHMTRSRDSLRSPTSWVSRLRWLVVHVTLLRQGIRSFCNAAALGNISELERLHKGGIDVNGTTGGR
jgi:hypothetical protein